LKENLLSLAHRVAPHYDHFEYHFALGKIWDSIRHSNRYLDETRPWTLAKEGKKEGVAAVLYNSAEALRILSVILSPILPRTADRIGEQLGIGPLEHPRIESIQSWGGIPGGTRVQKAPPLFPKIEIVPEAEEFV
jgi:methionyl-tRNA synthetase